jgi:hypothetical protein
MTALGNQWNEQLNAAPAENEKARTEMRIERDLQRQDMRAERELSYQMHARELDRNYETVTRLFDQMNLHTGTLARVESETKANSEILKDLKRKAFNT